MDKEEFYNLIGQRNPHRRGGNKEHVTGHKLLDKALASPANVRFNEVVKLVEAFGFRLSRASGSHHIFGSSGRQGVGEYSGRKRYGQTLSSPAVSETRRTV